MALNLNNIDYSGAPLAMEIIRESFSTSLIHTTFGARIINGIKGKGVWHSAGIDLSIGAGTTCPDFASNAELTQNTVDVCDYSASGKIDHDALVNTYRERFLNQGVLNESTENDQDLFNAIVEMLIKEVSQEQGIKFLNADASYASDCADGLLLQFEDSSLPESVPGGNLINPTASGDAIDPATVQTELSKVLNTMPGKYKYGNIQSRPKFAVSYEIMDAYQQSLTYQAPQAAAGGQGANPNVMSYRGSEMVAIDGLAAEQMFLTPPDNIALVFDSNEDLTNLVIRNALNDSSLCKQLAYRIDWRAGALFGQGDAVVYYRPA